MITEAKKEDIIFIKELGLEDFENFDKTYNIEEYIKNDNYVILVHKDSNKINGFMIVYKNIDYYELEMIIVSSNCRREGIGTQLLNYFIKVYCQKDSSILLEVSVENNRAINLYKKFNFKTINIRKKYYGNIDAYVMKKVIK